MTSENKFNPVSSEPQEPYSNTEQGQNMMPTFNSIDKQKVKQ